MATPGQDFQAWLTERLQAVSRDIDTDVFVTYIIGMLDTEAQDDQHEDDITELLAGVVDPDTAWSLCQSIISQWNVDLEGKKASQVTEDVADQLSMIFEKQALATVTEKKLSKEEAARKAAILAQYGQVSDGEETDPEELTAEESSTPSIVSASAGSAAKVKGDMRDTNVPLLMRNVNKEEVMRVEKEKRDKAKEEQEKKKEKDKQDRLAQKQKQQERKETEKKRTQKGEKRR
ncbi:hypothetical protein BsWGS_14507 [Bradybaena similaris]